MAELADPGIARGGGGGCGRVSLESQRTRYEVDEGRTNRIHSQMLPMTVKRRRVSEASDE